MKINQILFAASLLIVGYTAQAQTAWKGKLGTLMDRIPQSTTCEGGYGLCDHTTDDRKYITITGLGSGFTSLEKQMMEASGAPVPGSMPADGQAPSPEQIEAMKQQALAKMAAAQNMTPQQAAQMKKPTGSMPTIDSALGHQIGKAQNAAIEITKLVNEMSQKMNKIYKAWDSVKLGPRCGEVMYKGLETSTCGCLIARATKYETSRTASLNAYISAVAELAHRYKALIRQQLDIVDDIELNLKYGDAVNNPSYRQVLVMAQRQAMNGVTTIMSAFSGITRDGAEQQARLLNAGLDPGGCAP
jgi:hypothetical protein